MSAAVCPICNALLSSSERSKPICPKCNAPLPKVQEVSTISSQRFVRRVDLWNDRGFCLNMSIGCVVLSVIAIALGFFALQNDSDNSTVISTMLGIASFAAVAGAGWCGFVGLAGGMRNQWGQIVAITAVGLILSVIQFAYWIAIVLTFLLGEGEI